MTPSDPVPEDRETIPLPAWPDGAGGGWRSLPSAQRRTLVWFATSLGILTLAFFKPLASLFIYVAGTELHSHVILIPFISAYLLRLRWGQLPTQYESSPVGAIVMAVLGTAALVGDGLRRSADGSLSVNDHLAVMSLAYVCFLAALGFFFLGRRWMTAAAFPVSFLIFMVPLPDGVAAVLEQASQRGSSETANWFFQLAGVPVLRDGNVFRLPGITLQVAKECSGIRSSWVLFITGLLTANLFLHSPWRRMIFVVLIIPLGLLRNGFRIMVIGWLCVEVGPHMIDSPIHHRGGPIFFVLSLVPLLLLVWWLRRGEVKAPPVVMAQ